MQRSGGGAGKLEVAMTSASRLAKRRQRSSMPSLLEHRGEGDGDVKLQETVAARDEVDKKDLDLLVRNKRRRGDVSPQGCDAREEGEEISGAARCDDEEFEVEHHEVSPVSMAKSSTRMLSPNQRSSRSRQSLVWKMSRDVIGPVPRKARSGCVRRWPHEYPASGGHSHQQHSDFAASGSGEANEFAVSNSEARKTNKNAGSKPKFGKASHLSGSIDKDIEIEVAEVLFGLMRQSQLPDIARDFQQEPNVLDVKESERIRGDEEACSVEINIEQVGKSGGSELNLMTKDVVPVSLENTETLIEGDGLVKEMKKETSLSLTGHRLDIESRRLVATKAIQIAPLPEDQTGKLEINLMDPRNQDTEGFSDLAQGSKWSPKDVDMKTVYRTKKHMLDMTVGKPERSCSSLDAAKAAQSTPSFSVRKALCPTDSSRRHMQPLKTIAFTDKSSGASTFRKMSQLGQKRCAAHYHIAQSIMHDQQCAKVNLSSYAAGSTCSNINDVPSSRKEVIERQAQVATGGNGLIPNTAVSGCSKDRQNATEVSCLGISSQIKQYHKAPDLSSSEKMIAPALVYPLNVYQIAGPNSDCSGTVTPVSASSPKITSRSKDATAAGALTTRSTFSKMDPSMSFYNADNVTSEAPLMAIIPSNGYVFPVSAPVGSSGSSKGGVGSNAMPYFNSSLYPPQMFYPPQLPNQHCLHQAPILPSGQSAAKLRHSSPYQKHSDHQLQDGPNDGGHSLLPSSTVHAQHPPKQHVLSSQQSCKPEVDMIEPRALITDNRIFYGQRSAYKPHDQASVQPISFTVMPMIAGNGNGKILEKQESNQSPKVGVEVPASQAFSMPYSSFGWSNNASGINFSLSAGSAPLFPTLPEAAHQRYLFPQTADVVNPKKCQAGGKSCIDFISADTARKGATGKPSSGESQSPAFSKALSYDQSSMRKGCSNFEISANALNFNAASEIINCQSHHCIQLQQQTTQGGWNKTPVTNGQGSSVMSTNLSHSPVLMSHPARWNSSAMQPLPQATPSLPTSSNNAPHQVVYSPNLMQITSGGTNVKSVAAQGNRMSVMQCPSALSTGHQSRYRKSSQTRSTRSKSDALVSPKPQLNETSSNRPSQKLSSPVCRRNVPSILNTCPGQASEPKY